MFPPEETVYTSIYTTHTNTTYTGFVGRDKVHNGGCYLIEYSNSTQ
jgi:hypothetical protein